jgi:hypothetical protein
MNNLIYFLFIVLIVLLFVKVDDIKEHMYFYIPTRYCNPSKIMSYDIRGDIPINPNQIKPVPFYSSEFIQDTPKQCVDSSKQFQSILLD